MRLYSGKIPTVGSEIVKSLVEAGDIEVTDRGEAEILGQVREAFATAVEGETAGDGLTQLFRTAISAGRRARAETGIGVLKVAQEHRVEFDHPFTGIEVLEGEPKGKIQRALRHVRDRECEAETAQRQVP